MRFLLGDSTDAGLEVNYLAFLKDVIDCAVVLLEHEGTLTSGGDRRRVHEKEAGVVVAALEELGRRSTELAEAVAKEQKDNAIGRCAQTIVTQTREAVEKEIAGVKTALAADLAKVAQDDQSLRVKGTDAIDKLLRAHELPGAEKVIEVTWTAMTVKAVSRQKTGYGVEATTGLEIPAGSELVPDLRVDKLAENAELNALEVGGWLKKSDKLVPYKIGRYHVVKVTAANDTTVRLRSTSELTSGGFDLVLARGGDLTVENVTGEPVRELTIDGSNKGVLEGLVKKLDTAVRALGEKRTGLIAVTVDGKTLGEQPRSGVLAERLIQAVAPMVVKIATHSRSPGELVLRRMLSEDRREEIFVPVADLTRRWANLPPASRDVFAALRLEADPAAPLPEHSGPQRRQVPTSVPVNRPRLPSSAMPPSPPTARAGGPTSAMPTVVVPPAAGSPQHHPRATTQTIPAASVPVPHTTPAPAITSASVGTSGTAGSQPVPTLSDSVRTPTQPGAAVAIARAPAAAPAPTTPSASVLARMPSPASAAPTAGSAALASVWSTPATAVAAPAAAAAAAPPPASSNESSTVFISDLPPQAGSGVPAPVDDDDDDDVAEDDLVEEDEPSPEQAPVQILPSVAEALARAEKSPETRQARLDRLNDPVQYARLSAAIEAALGEIEDDEPANH